MRAMLFLALVVAGQPASQPCGTLEAGAELIGGPYQDARAEVGAVLVELFRAAEAREVARIESLHLYGPKFTKFDEFGLGREDAEQTRTAERIGLSGVKSFKADIEDLKVDVFGPTAVATFLLHYKAETMQGQVTRTLRSTVVLVEDTSGWRIVHEHFSPLAPTQ